MQCWSFVDNAWREGESPSAKFTWFDITGSDDSALDTLAARFGLHPLAVEDCRSTLRHAPKVDDFGSNLFIVLQAVVATEDDSETEELDLFLGSNYLISYQDRRIQSEDSQGQSPAESLRAALAHNVAVRPGPDGLLYDLADRLVDDILPRVNALAESLDTMQDQIVLSRRSRVEHSKILAIRAQAGRIRRVMTPQLAVIQRLSRGEFALISEANRVYFRDIYDHLIRIDLALEGLREDAEVALSTYLSAINNRLSEVMKVLAVVSALMLPSTVITGVFGTNFDNVPGLHSNSGFVLMIIAMVGIGAGMALYFRRRGWF